MRLSIAFTVAAAAILASCATEVSLVGTNRDAISRDDVAAIERLVSQRRDLPGWQLSIRPLSPTKAEVVRSSNYNWYTFTVRKTHGEWKVDDATIHRDMILL